LVRLLAFFLLTFALIGFAAVPAGIVNHAFEFNMLTDNQDSIVLDYRYGDTKSPTARNPIDLAKEGESLQSTNIYGPMLRGEFLYVKWRNKTTAQIYEDNVDLRKRLPSDITDKKVYFMIRGAQLFVYLISLNEERPATVPVEGPRAYRSFKTIRIYPD